MSSRVRLDEALPARIGGVAGAVSELDLQTLSWRPTMPGDAPADDGLELPLPGGPITGTVRPLGEVDEHGARAFELALDDTGRHRLMGHLSSLRKDAHLRIVAEEDVEARDAKAGWQRFRLPHDALPELHPDELDLGTTLLGKRLAAPLLVAGMTGGSRRAGVINARVATAAQELGLGMGLGSQRAMLELPELTETFAVRRYAPDILLVGNVGAVQLNYGVTVDDCRRLVDGVQADALAVHLNVLQELVQPEGDRDWRGLRRKVEQLVAALPVPVLLKETGCGVGPEVARWARDVGVAAIDVGGTGGTSWGWIEGFRAAEPQRRAIGSTFRDWGLPTADAVRRCRAAVGPDYPIVATGGLRSGLHAAVALALGADVAGFALPFFRAADASEDEAVALGRRLIEELRIAMVCSGSGSVGALRDVELEELA